MTKYSTEHFLRTAIFHLPAECAVLIRHPREVKRRIASPLPSPTGATGRAFGVKQFPGVQLRIIDHSIYSGVRVALLWPDSRALGGWSQGALPVPAARPRAGVVVSSSRLLLAYGVRDLADFEGLLAEYDFYEGAAYHD